MLTKIDSEMDEEDIFDPTEESPDEVVPFKYSITSYGADYPVDALIKRLNSKDLFIPEFQRSYVWSYKQACRFIESLLLGLPIPGIFLARETDTGKLLVIDGNQRLNTLKYFYTNNFKGSGKGFALDYVQEEFKGKTYNTLNENDRRKLDDSLIHATIIRQDEPSEDNSSIYHIFERLNTGGVELSPQEIRACIYHGKFNELIYKLNSEDNWRNIYGKPNQRMKDQELILRFFALNFGSKNYQRPMKNFLNSFMLWNRNLDKISAEDLEKIFSTTTKLIVDGLGEKPFRISNQINVAVAEAVMIGIAYNLKQNKVLNPKYLKDKYDALLKDESFMKACSSGTSDEKTVRTRADISKKMFEALE